MTINQKQYEQIKELREHLIPLDRYILDIEEIEEFSDSSKRVYINFCENISGSKKIFKDLTSILFN